MKDRIVDSGNYVLEDLKGNQIKDSYPRWKLKAIDNFKDNKIKIDENLKTVKIQNFRAVSYIDTLYTLFLSTEYIFL